MGASSSSTPGVPKLDDLESSQQRTLLRNLQLLAGRDQSRPGKFSERDWREVHSSMPSRLAGGLWAALSSHATGGGSAHDMVLGLDEVTSKIVPLAAGGGSAAAPSLAARQHLEACYPGSPATAVEVAFDEAAPWLASVEQPSDAADVPRTPEAAAAILAAAACAAWLLDMRSMQPLPALSEGSSRLLTSAHVRALSSVLPSEQRREWRLLFATFRDGTSFSRFVSLGMGRTPCLVVIRDRGGAIFGGFAAEPPRPSPQFGGGYGSFLFRVAPGPPAIFPASGANANLLYFNVSTPPHPGHPTLYLYPCLCLYLSYLPCLPCLPYLPPCAAIPHAPTIRLLVRALGPTVTVRP